MIRFLVGALLKPFTALGEKYLDNQKDKERLKHGTTRVAMQADANVRAIKLGTLLGAIPLFVAEASVAVYVAAIMVDSTWPSVYINPLELPEWFKPYFNTAVISIFGVTAADRVATKWNRK